MNSKTNSSSNDKEVNKEIRAIILEENGSSLMNKENNLLYRGLQENKRNGEKRK